MLRFLRKALVVTADEVEIKVIIPNQLGVFDVFDVFRANVFFYSCIDTMLYIYLSVYNSYDYIGLYLHIFPIMFLLFFASRESTLNITIISHYTVNLS